MALLHWLTTLVWLCFTLRSASGQAVPLGCYSDDYPNNPVLDGIYHPLGNNTPDHCSDYCQWPSWDAYEFAGVINGTICACGTTRPDPARLVDGGNCSIPCPGDPSITCGGLNYTYVYEMYPWPYPEPTTTSDHSTTEPLNTVTTDVPITPLGCYANTTLDGPNTTMSNLTPAACINNCSPYGYSSFGYTFAGVFNGTICACGSTYPDPNNKVDDSECNITCPGDPTLTCGGLNLTYVYELDIYPATTAISDATTTTVTGCCSDGLRYPSGCTLDHQVCEDGEWLSIP